MHAEKSAKADSLPHDVETQYGLAREDGLVDLHVVRHVELVYYQVVHVVTTEFLLEAFCPSHRTHGGQGREEEGSRTQLAP